MSRATLNDLVEDFLKLELGYGEEIVVNHGDNLLYDVDETENLSKKLSELGIKGDSFLTIIDDDDENPKGPRVNLLLNVQESATPDDKPIKSLDIAITPVTNGDSPASPIPRRKKPSPPSNGHVTNGALASTNGGSATKRRASEAFGNESPLSKKAKIQQNSVQKDVIEIEDTDGAILIDD